MTLFIEVLSSKLVEIISYLLNCVSDKDTMVSEHSVGPVDDAIDSGSAPKTLGCSLIDMLNSYEDAGSGHESNNWGMAEPHVVDGLVRSKARVVGDLPLNKKAIRLR